MKHLVILRGLPGSGKTSFSDIFKYVWYMKSVSADDYFYNDKGEYNFDRKMLAQAHNYCYNKVERLLTEDHAQVIFVHNTFTTEEEIKPYQLLAERFNARFTSLIVENRHGNESIHGVPEEKVNQMQDRFSTRL